MGTWNKSGRKWENMFFGSYAHSLDDKNRLVIPSKMRSEVGARLYIMKGFDGAISMYPEKAFEKLMAEGICKIVDKFNHLKRL